MTTFMLQSGLSLARPHGGDLNAAIVFETIHNANIQKYGPHKLAALLMASPTSATPWDDLQPVSVNAIAQSLSLPYETVRTLVVSLIGAQVCRRVKGGVVVEKGVTDLPTFQSAYRGVYVGLLRATHELAGLGFGLAPLSTVDQPLAPDLLALRRSPLYAELAARTVLRFQLKALESFVPSFGGVLSGFVWAGILDANIRHLKYASAEAWKYAFQDTPPPDSARIPISVRALSIELNLPLETCRRRVNALVQQGRVRVVPRRGVIVPTDMLSADQLGSNNPILLVHVLGMAQDLKAIGFDFSGEP